MNRRFVVPELLFVAGLAKILWRINQAAHVGAFEVRFPECEERVRVVGFFGQALLEGGG